MISNLRFAGKSLKEIVSERLGIVLSVPPGSDEQSVLLTFDDGPHPDNTPRILDLLDQYNAKGIFFVVGNRIAKAPHMLREIIDRGHQLGNHSYSHWLASPPGYRKYRVDLEKCQREITRLTGVTCKVFRPPLGQITPASILAARRLGLTYMLWTIDSGDWKIRDDDTAREQGSKVESDLKPGDIVLMHDDNPHTPALLESILQGQRRTQNQLHS